MDKKKYRLLNFLMNIYTRAHSDYILMGMNVTKSDSYRRSKTKCCNLHFDIKHRKIWHLVISLFVFEVVTQLFKSINAMSPGLRRDQRDIRPWANLLFRVLKCIETINLMFFPGCILYSDNGSCSCS
jgi:hypothetical protein